MLSVCRVYMITNASPRLNTLCLEIQYQRPHFGIVHGSQSLEQPCHHHSPKLCDLLSTLHTRTHQVNCIKTSQRKTHPLHGRLLHRALSSELDLGGDTVTFEAIK